MQFWQYITTRSQMKIISPEFESMSVSEFYAKSIEFSATELHDKSSVRQQLIEGLWEMSKRPYYRVYPSIIPMLVRLNLSVDSSAIKLPLQTFVINFPTTEHKLSFDIDGSQYFIRSILCGPASLENKNETYSGISIWIDFGETMRSCGIADGPAGDFPVLTYINMPIKKGISVEESSKMLRDDPSATVGLAIPPAAKASIIKLVCTLCLLENDSSIIEPDVLDKDRAKYERQPDQIIVDRAIRRGKIGWNVGRKIETIPHVRGPSPLALYWTGPGKRIPLIRYRKGCIVHKELVTKVPTSFEDDDEAQEHQTDDETITG